VRKSDILESLDRTSILPACCVY